jgi:hypothetical protein
MKALYKYNPITGYWTHVRNCEESTAQEWLRTFQADDPQAKFELRKTKESPTRCRQIPKRTT